MPRRTRRRWDETPLVARLCEEADGVCGLLASVAGRVRAAGGVGQNPVAPVALVRAVVAGARVHVGAAREGGRDVKGKTHVGVEHEARQDAVEAVPGPVLHIRVLVSWTPGTAQHLFVVFFVECLQRELDDRGQWRKSKLLDMSHNMQPG